MSKKPTVTTIAGGYYSRQALNDNFTALRDAFDNTLSRDGSTPNAMLADLDMNSNDILNVGEIDVQALSIGGVDIYPGNTQIATTYATQNYTGNGSTTTYAMGYNPGSKANVDVYIDGVYQNQDAFNITGTSLTFTAAPPLNSAIEIKVPVNVTSLTNTDSSQIVYNQGGTGAVTTNVKAKLQEFVSVKDFGAVDDYNEDANTGTDNSAAFQAAIDYCVTNLKALYIPSGQYLVRNKLTIDGSGGTVKMFRVIGDAVGNSAEQSASGTQTFSRPAIYYDGTDALFEFDLSGFFFYGFSFEGVNFFQPRISANTQTASCIKLLNGTATVYQRNMRAIDCNFSYWDNVYEAIYSGSSPTDSAAYIGPTMFTRCHVRSCAGSFMRIDKAALNRVFITDSYLHGFNNGCIKFVNNGWAYISFLNTTVEGAEPAVVDASDTNLIYKIYLDGFAAEKCGNEPANGGWGFLKPQISAIFPTRATIHISNNGYGFFNMPSEFRLSRGSIINSAHDPVLVSGFGWETDTPERILPYVSNNAAYGQSELYSMGFTRRQLMPDGGDVSEIAWSSNFSGEGLTVSKNNLPRPLVDDAIGTSELNLFRDNQGGMVAPEDGYFILNGATSTIGLGRLNSAGSLREINISRSAGGSDAVTIDRQIFSETDSQAIGYFIAIAAEAGDEITDGQITFDAGAVSWATPININYIENNVTMNSIVGANKASVQVTATVANSATDTIIVQPLAKGSYFAKVEVYVSDRSYAAYYVSGDVARFVTPNRDVSQVVKVEQTGITITPVTGAQDGAIANIQIANTTGADVDVRIIGTLLG